MRSRRRRKRRFEWRAIVRQSRWIVVLCALASLSACRTEPDPLRFGVLAWPPYDLAHLAVERDFIDPSTFDLVNFQTPSEVIRSFRYGLIDAMFVTSHFALSTLREVEDLRIIYVLDVSLGGDALLAKPGFDSAETLEGARIGVESAALGIYTLVRALGELGLTRHDIEVVNVDTPQQLRAWRSDEIDAVVAYEPTRSLVKRDGGIELFNSASIPYEILDVLVVRESVIDARGDDLARFVGALDRSIAVYRKEMHSISEHLAQRHSLTTGEFRAAMASVELFALEDNLAMLAEPSHPVLEALSEQCRIMIEAGMLVSEPDLEPLLDARVVERAARQ